MVAVYDVTAVVTSWLLTTLPPAAGASALVRFDKTWHCDSRGGKSDKCGLHYFTSFALDVTCTYEFKWTARRPPQEPDGAAH